MRRTAKVTVSRKLYPIMNRLKGSIAEKLTEVAEETKGNIQQYLATGTHGLNNDSMAASASMYIVAEGPYFKGGGQAESYVEASQQFLELYAARYSMAHGKERLLEPFTVESTKTVIRTAAASCSLYMGFWEEGHNNRLTGKEEHRPHFEPAAYEIAPTIVRRFAGLIRGGK